MEDEILLSRGTIRLSGLECPVCRSRADSYTGMSRDMKEPARVPKAGNISFCINCKAVLVYIDSFASYRPLSLRVATEQEIAKLSDDPNWSKVYKALVVGSKRPKHG